MNVKPLLLTTLITATLSVTPAAQADLLNKECFLIDSNHDYIWSSCDSCETDRSNMLYVIDDCGSMATDSLTSYTWAISAPQEIGNSCSATCYGENGSIPCLWKRCDWRNTIIKVY